jgi:hypothetical protein
MVGSGRCETVIYPFAGQAHFSYVGSGRSENRDSRVKGFEFDSRSATARVEEPVM